MWNSPARDNVVLLTDDREALIEALETAPAEELSALRAIGEQFTAPAETVAQHSPPERPTVLDDTTRERRRAAERFVGHALSAAGASIREWEERAREASGQGAHVNGDGEAGVPRRPRQEAISAALHRRERFPIRSSRAAATAAHSVQRLSPSGNSMSRHMFLMSATRPPGVSREARVAALSAR